MLTILINVTYIDNIYSLQAFENYCFDKHIRSSCMYLKHDFMAKIGKELIQINRSCIEKAEVIAISHNSY